MELAILLVPLMVLAFGTTETGRALYYYNTLLKATRDAARYASMSAGAAQDAQAVCHAVYGQSCGSTLVPLVPGLEPANVRISHRTQSTGSGAVDVVTVTIQRYAFTPVIGWPVGSLTFGDISCTMRQAAS
ncbi:MAG TPA: TadE/TadG family type IV pilus assembly protein [Ramlibacter sp.]|uniref:TadE/TadG family type IV pilus assembly protein n=1 Tax=Ramlibacter sp. TaxID=1917967 RepID=UPI002D7FE7F1|nr:TadE/TadG family type IV pilus assembly protein [Ramlibacter sp.]HET8746398.1 TadE/TadG family type IV pilus assembly protein [Ramlibacter sp.]